MIVKRVPLEWVNQTWPRVERFISAAIEHSSGEYTLDIAKNYVITNYWILLVAVEGEEIHGAATIYFYNRLNDRVAFVTAIGGKLISNPDTFKQLKDFAVSNGATVIEGAARESIARLWCRYGFKEKHRIVGVKL
jgi:hypothetical protein